jgi:hypothetical protein
MNTLNTQIKVGDCVSKKDGQLFCTENDKWSHVTVVSVEPLILVGIEPDTRLVGNHNVNDLVVNHVVSEEHLARCMKLK